MGWKNIKDHYRIGHIVHVSDGKICIGSPYISDIISVTFVGKLSWGKLGPSKNEELARYYAEMTADPAKLKELIDAPDKFMALQTVYTYDGAEIIEKQCEEYGWPNITTDGRIQYDNEFSPDKAVVIGWAKRSAKYGVERWKEHITDAEKRLAKCRKELAEEEATLAKLEADYPGVGTEPQS